MSQRIRGKEATIQIVVDGDLKRGSFAKVTEFNLTPRQDLDETPFLGEVEDDLDINHRGYDFSWTMHAQDKRAMDLLQDIVSRERARTAHPAINVVVTFEYRSPLEPAYSIVLESCFIKMDGLNMGGANDYVTNSFSGKCKVVSPL